MEVAERSEQRWEREKATSKCSHGLSASLHHLSCRGGGGFGDRFTAGSLFTVPKRYYKEKSGGTGMKEAELVQGMLTIDACIFGC